MIYYNGKQARTRALIDLLVNHKSDITLTAVTRRVYALQENGGRLSHHVDKDSDERKDILKVLNTHEFIAVGVRMKAFDERVYKEMQCTNVLRLWSAARGFVQEIRAADGKETIFQDFERMAKCWKKSPVKKIQ